MQFIAKILIGLLLRNPHTTKKIAIKVFHANAIRAFAKIIVEH